MSGDVERHAYAPGGRRGLCLHCGHGRHHPYHGAGASSTLRRSTAGPSPELPRITSHQRQVLDQLTRRCASAGGGWVPAETIGSRGALDHLVEKGHAERRTASGPRGGEHVSYRPTSAPPLCTSCEFPAGARTGALVVYVVDDAPVVLCDDCARAAGDQRPAVAVVAAEVLRAEGDVWRYTVSSDETAEVWELLTVEAAADQLAAWGVRRHRCYAVVRTARQLAARQLGRVVP